MKRVLAMLLAAVLLVGLVPTVALAAGGVIVKSYDEVATGDDAAVALALAQLLLGDDVEIVEGSAKLIYGNKKQIAAFTNGDDPLGISSGVMLSTGDAKEDFGTSGNKNYDVHYEDPDLRALIQKEGVSYGGDTVLLEFQLEATGEMFNFDYSFASAEFDQPPKYNDIFGLFVKVNDGDFENIALLDNGKYVTITNLRTDPEKNPNGNKLSSSNELQYVTADFSYQQSQFNGYSHVFTAKKQVEIGDLVTIKFVIADVGDTSYDSAVFIRGGSLSFNAGSRNPLTSTDGSVTLELGEALTDASQLAVFLDGEALTAGADYTVNMENGYLPVITFLNPEGLDGNSKIKVEITTSEGKVLTVNITNRIPKEEEPTPVEHHFELKKDEENHWMECIDAGCGETKDTAAHTFELKKNDDNHWLQCTNEDCAYTKDTAAHTFELKKNDDNHWLQCTNEGCAYTKDTAAHTFELKKNDDNHWLQCTNEDCAYTKDTAAHTFELQKDEDNHWLECTNADCAYMKDCESHDLELLHNYEAHWWKCTEADCSIILYRENHIASEWIIDTPARVGRKGAKHKECIVCEEILVRASIPALPGMETNGCDRGTDCPLWLYTDVQTTAWYHDGVHFCIEEGLMQGVADHCFAPNMTTTRAQIVTMLWRLEGSPLVQIAEDFIDVKESDWYYLAIRWASNKGIVEGYGDSVFGANDDITREQLATILWRYAKYKGYDVSVGENTNILSYQDAFDISGWAMPAMQWACGSGLIQGVAMNNTMYIQPQGDAVRSQSATMIYRFCTEIKK